MMNCANRICGHRRREHCDFYAGDDGSCGHVIGMVNGVELYCRCQHYERPVGGR